MTAREDGAGAEPVRFARTARSKAVGCAVYLVGGPIAALFLALFLSVPFTILADSKKISKETAETAWPVILISTLGAMFLWSVRDYRRRAFAEVLLFPDRVEVADGKSRRTLHFSELRSLDLVQTHEESMCVLTAASGEKFPLPPDIAAFEKMGDELDGLVAELRLRIEEELAAGRSVSVVEGRLRSFARIAHGVGLMMMPPLLILSIKLALKSLRVFRYGVLLVRRGWRGRRGGFEIRPEALVPRGGSAVPWQDLLEVRPDTAGIVITTRQGRTVTASPYARNFVAASRWLAGPVPPKAGAWPEGVPCLYPGRDSRWLSSFLADDEHGRIMRVPRVMLLPLGRADSSDDDRALGLAVSRLLLRDLMLLPGLSVRGPEDTPTRILAEMDPNQYPFGLHEVIVGGSLVTEDGHLRAGLQLVRPGGAREEMEVQASDPLSLVAILEEQLVRALGVGVPQHARTGRQTGRPRDEETLRRFGHILPLPDGPGKQRALMELRRADPGFTLPAHALDPDEPGGREAILRSLDDDPHDAQLRFKAFTAVWRSVAPQPEALQFIRRAIELSPGHGKAHMCAGHAAHPDVDMIRHCVLGYRLLPGNPFAVSNLILRLKDRPDRDDDLLAKLCREGIESDSQDPSNFDLLIEVLERQGDIRGALDAARSLRRLLGPPMADRTRYCYEQNPQRKLDLESGRFDPVRETDSRIASLSDRLRTGR